MSEVISPFKSLKTGSQVFAILMLSPCVILHAMWSGFGMLCLSAISMMFVNIRLAVCKFGGCGGLS